MVRFVPLLVLFSLLGVASAFFFGGHGGSPPPHPSGSPPAFPSGRPRFPPRGSRPPHTPHFSGSPPPFPHTGTPPQDVDEEVEAVEKRQAGFPDDVEGSSGSPP